MALNTRFRLVALCVFVGAAAVLTHDVWRLRTEGRFTPLYFMLCGMCLAVSPFMLIAGRHDDPRTGKPARWWNVTCVILSSAGAALGAWVALVVL